MTRSPSHLGIILYEVQTKTAKPIGTTAGHDVPDSLSLKTALLRRVHDGGGYSRHGYWSISDLKPKVKVVVAFFPNDQLRRSASSNISHGRGMHISLSEAPTAVFHCELF